MAWLVFESWARLELEYDTRAVNRFFFRVAQESAKAFREGVDGPHTGQLYHRRGRLHQASRNRTRAEFPASDSGALRKSIKGRSTNTTATVGTSVPYSRWLQQGTRKMRPRKMSKEALQIGIRTARGTGGFRDWIRWKRAGA